MTRFVARISSALLALLAVSCSVQEPTELVVVVDGAIPGLDRVQIRVESEGRTRVDEDLRLGERLSLPLSFGMISRADGDALVEVRVVGYASEALVVRSEARTRFLPFQRRVLRIWLDPSCGVVPGCPARETCREGSCVDAYVDPATLPPYRGELPDAGTSPGHDAGGMDGGVRDGGEPFDASVPDGGAGDGGGGDAGDAGGGCAGDAGVVPMPPGCVLERWPARPTCGDSGDDGSERFIALLDPLFEQGGGRWRTIGFDLDGFCTDPFTAPNAIECTTMGGIAPDGERGIDNAVGNVLATGLLAAFPGMQESARRSMNEGRQVPVVRLAGWSGQPDDARVSMWLAGTVDTLTAETPLPSGRLEDHDELPDPRFDGTDRAYFASTYFDPITNSPLIYDDNAYVAGGVLVARLPDRAPFGLPKEPSGNAGRIRLTDTRLVARLSADGTRFESAVLIGRWARSDMLAYTTDLGLCGVDPESIAAVALFTSVLDHSLDVRSLPGSGGEGVPCDALSTAIPFERSAPVIRGGIVPYEIGGSGCP